MNIDISATKQHYHSFYSNSQQKKSFKYKLENLPTAMHCNLKAAQSHTSWKYKSRAIPSSPPWISQ